MSKKCIDCGKEIDKRSKRCRECFIKYHSKTPKEKFWEKVNKNGPTMRHMNSRCWEWTASFISNQSSSNKIYSYGALYINRKTVLAHRFSWELHNSKKIPKNMLVCHHCDNPKCINPSHLFLGTQKDNMNDMSKKGRAGVRHGVGNPKTKLTKKQVASIRKRYTSNTATVILLAKEYGISRSAIYDIIHYKTHRY